MTGVCACQQSARLEEIRLSILNNLIKYHPESGQSLGWGAAAPQDDTNDILHPLGPHKMYVFSCAPGCGEPSCLTAFNLQCIVGADLAVPIVDRA